MKARKKSVSRLIHFQKLGWMISHLVTVIVAELTKDGILPSNVKNKERVPMLCTGIYGKVHNADDNNKLLNKL
jgi:hypothetical protein